jgi:hypothetical protein
MRFVVFFVIIVYLSVFSFAFIIFLCHVIDRWPQLVCMDGFVALLPFVQYELSHPKL